jgi:hypothetical protein
VKPINYIVHISRKRWILCWVVSLLLAFPATTLLGIAQARATTKAKAEPAQIARSVHQWSAYLAKQAESTAADFFVALTAARIVDRLLWGWHWWWGPWGGWVGPWCGGFVDIYYDAVHVIDIDIDIAVIDAEIAIEDYVLDAELYQGELDAIDDELAHSDFELSDADLEAIAEPGIGEEIDDVAAETLPVTEYPDTEDSPELDELPSTEGQPDIDELPEPEPIPEPDVLPEAETYPEAEQLPDADQIPEPEAFPELEPMPTEDAHGLCRRDGRRFEASPAGWIRPEADLGDIRQQRSLDMGSRPCRRISGRTAPWRPGHPGAWPLGALADRRVCPNFREPTRARLAAANSPVSLCSPCRSSYRPWTQDHIPQVTEHDP